VYNNQSQGTRTRTPYADAEAGQKRQRVDGTLAPAESAAMTCTGQYLPTFLQWTIPGRIVVFFLSSTSIWCLLAEFYGLCSMRLFTLAVLLPAAGVLTTAVAVNKTMGVGRLWQAVFVGAVGGFVAAVAYDLFRLPFVDATGRLPFVGSNCLEMHRFNGSR
jgi:hypothetical protein